MTAHIMALACAVANPPRPAPSHRPVPARVLRWAHFVGYSRIGAHVQMVNDGIAGQLLVVDGALHRRAAESRALEQTR